MHAHIHVSLSVVVTTSIMMVIASTSVYATTLTADGDATDAHPVWLGENDRLGVIAIPKVRILAQRHILPWLAIILPVLRLQIRDAVSHH